MLNKKFLKKIKKILEKEKKDLRKELNKLAKKDTKPKGDFDTIFPNLGQQQDDNAIEVTLYGNTLPIEHNLETRLLNAEKALLAIKNKKYGICKACNKEISQARLEIMPETELCIKCKQKQNF